MGVEQLLDQQRRRTMRFPLDVRVVFWWLDASGAPCQGQGRSYDVSELGAFVISRACPPVGTGVDLRIAISARPDTPRNLRVDVHGRVVRVEKIKGDEGRDGFAIVTDQAILHENSGIDLTPN